MKKTRIVLMIALTFAILLGGTALADKPEKPNGGSSGGGGGVIVIHPIPEAKIYQGQEAETLQLAVQIAECTQKKQVQDQMIGINQDQLATKLMKGKVYQDQEACAVQIAIQAGKMALKQSQLETIDIAQNQAVTGNNGWCWKQPSGNIDQDQEAFVAQLAVQIGGRSVKQDQWIDADVYQNQTANSDSRIEQDQEAGILQAGIQIGCVVSDQDQDLWAVIDQDQANKANFTHLDQDQEACAVQIAIQAGNNSKQDQRSDTIISQNQLNRSGDNVSQSQQAGVTQIAIQAGVNANQGQYQGTFVNQAQKIK